MKELILFIPVLTSLVCFILTRNHERLPRKKKIQFHGKSARKRNEAKLSDFDSVRGLPDRFNLFLSHIHMLEVPNLNLLSQTFAVFSSVRPYSPDVSTCMSSNSECPKVTHFLPSRTSSSGASLLPVVFLIFGCTARHAES